jgi:hypothetical protein
MTNTMLGTITFRALGIHARRILDFLLYEHASHAARENGNLSATYEQLEAWGLTAADIRKGFEELYVTGFVVLTKQGLRQAGGGEPSRFALTWLPTQATKIAEQPPSHVWRDVIARLGRAGVGNVAEARRWLKGEVAQHARGHRKIRRPTPHLQVVSPIIREARNGS